MLFQRIVQGDEELWREAFLADLERGFEPLGLGLESAYLVVNDRNHRSESTPIRPQCQD